ncbi:MAG: hypothetical protein HY898_20640 [Deltaproteobacteria bacterium]|nr:hypothetical protein [Deltaproteobacteria bacterium]
MTTPVPPRTQPQASYAASAEGLTPAERLQIFARWMFGDAPPKPRSFHAGDVLIAEGEDEPRRPALLVISGELEECVGSYSQESGPGEHTVHVASTGDFADLQAIVAPYCEEPAQCSVHANTDGTCYPVWLAQVAHRPEVAAVVSLLHASFTEAVDRQRAMAVEYEELAAHVRELEGDESTAGKGMSVRAVLDEWENSSREDLTRKIEEMQDEIDKAHVSAWEAKERAQEAQKWLDLERRARAALEQRVVEMMRQLAGQANPEVDEKFPNAIRILESAELEEMETSARQHREMAENYVARARMLHRAFERLANDNPDLVVKPDVMQLMLGEEPHAPETEESPQELVQGDPQEPKRVTVPFENTDGESPPPAPVQIPRSAPLPQQLVDSLVPDDDWEEEPDLVEGTPSPGTRRSR